MMPALYTSPGSSLNGWLYKYMNNKHNNDILSSKYYVNSIFYSKYVTVMTQF